MIRELFSKAKRAAPSIIYIDEIDAIASKRDISQRQMETRIVTQLLTCMEGADYSGSSDATNRLDAIDSALRRPGRFDCEI
ncbi:cell division control protein 48 C-like, partial [Trifolium medium]|nr:cell division control protein 48 C-like [Trifolium medium]